MLRRSLLQRLAALPMLRSVFAGVPHPSNKNSARNRVIKIQFKRSGGFSPITNVAGEVHFSGDGAEVSSSGGTYRRTLEAEERTQLQDLAHPEPQQPNSQSGPGKLRDAFQYDIAVTTADGKTHKLTSPSAPLLKWVKDESDKILKHKVEPR